MYLVIKMQIYTCQHTTYELNCEPYNFHFDILVRILICGSLLT
jgi:hypothetical protein